MNFKRLVCFLLVLVMALSMVACNNGEDVTQETEGATGEPATYGVKVQSAGGMPLEGIGVYIYAASDIYFSAITPSATGTSPACGVPVSCAAVPVMKRPPVRV